MLVAVLYESDDVSQVSEQVQAVLDVIPVTDTVYHHLVFTRPLVDALVGEVRRIGQTGRVLVIGPNELLPQVLVELGYEVDLWVLDGLPLSEDLQRRGSRFGPLDQVLAAGARDRVDVVLAPYVAEAANLEPDELLRTLGAHLKPGGRVVLACRQPGELRRRLRRVMRKLKARVGPDELFAPSPTWPALPIRRFLTIRSLAAAAAEGQFRVVKTRLVVDQQAYINTQALSLWKWLLKEGLFLSKIVMPRVRDCALVTLVPTMTLVVEPQLLTPVHAGFGGESGAES